MATSEELAFQNAKAYLLKNSTVSNTNIYDHLAQLINKLLDERPEDAVDVVEDVSRDLKGRAFKQEAENIQEVEARSEAVALAEAQSKLFETKVEEETEADEDMQPVIPDLAETAFYFEQTSVGLSREELFRIFLAMKQLTQDQPVETVRFWGKIFGTRANYIVAEVEFKDGEGDEEDQLENDEGDGDIDVPQRESSEDQEDDMESPDEPPKSQYKPPPVIPREENRMGTNKKTYFVTNEPGTPWVRLPPVTPPQIAIAQKIRKFLTGRLDAPIVSNPPFPGTETNYLRAQIQRISAATQVSPMNYYQFEEDEEEEEEEARDSFIVNTEFEGMPYKELADPSLNYWVHHVQYILPQGRCVWYNPVQKAEEEFEDEEEEEEREEPDEPEPEKGPALLTPLSEDAQVDGQPSWSTTLSTSFATPYTVVGIHSNRWPGAHAFAIDRKFENVYVGWGLKYQPGCFQPALPGAGEQEHVKTEFITETDDPTPEEEAALRAAQEGAEEQEQEEEDEEEDDD